MPYPDPSKVLSKSLLWSGLWSVPSTVKVLSWSLHQLDVAWYLAIICGIYASIERNQEREMLSGARQKSKQVPSLFPGNNGEHLQFDEESIASTYRWFRTTANKCESRWAGWVKRWQRKLKQTQCLKQKKWSKRPCRCLCCSNSDQLFGEHGARQQIRRGLAGKPETVAVSEIRHGLVPIQGGWKHDRLHLQPQQNPWAKPGEHVLPFCPLHPSVPHAPP